MPDKRIDLLTGAACFGAVVTGLLGIIAAVVSVVTMELLAAGVSILGAGVAFGFLANAILRD